MGRHLKNSKTVFIVIAGAVVLFGVLFLVLSGGEDPLASKSTPTPSNPTTEESNEQSSVSEEAKSPETNAQTNPNGYQDYDASAVAQTDGKKILFFHASWCPTCKALDQNIRAGVIPADLTIFKVNYDTADALRKKHGVTYQHTLVQVDSSGEQLKKWAGSYTIDQLVDETI